jgi:hypothetical protein
MFEPLTLILLIAFMVFREVLHYRQVQDLTLKIKAANVFEYETAKAAEKKPMPDVPAIAPKSFDELDPDEALKAISENLHEEE